MKKKFTIEYSRDDEQIKEFFEWKQYDTKRQAAKALKESTVNSEHFKISPVMVASVGGSVRTVRPLMKQFFKNPKLVVQVILGRKKFYEID